MKFIRLNRWKRNYSTMVVGTLKIEFLLTDNRSLKGKRKVVKSMIDKVRARFNVSIAEIGSNDKWQKIELGISSVGNDGRHVDSSLNHILSFLESLYLAQIVDTRMETKCTRLCQEWGSCRRARGTKTRFSAGVAGREASAAGVSAPLAASARASTMPCRSRTDRPPYRAAGAGAPGIRSPPGSAP